MSKKRKKKFKKDFVKHKKRSRFALPVEIKQMIFGVLMILVALIIGLSFFNKAGKAGDYFIIAFRFLIGEAIFLIPLILFLGGSVFINSKANQEILNRGKKLFWPVVLASFILISGITGLLATFDSVVKRGGWMGYILTWPFLKYFGFWATEIIFLGLIVMGGLIFWQFLRRPKKKKDNEILEEEKDVPEKNSIIKRIFAPKFKVKEISDSFQKNKEESVPPNDIKLETKPLITGAKAFSYQPPPLNLLSLDQGAPNSGDTKVNAAIIKKTLQNFNIEVIMSEVNIGPTVTQYTLKPSEGVKLSKITGLSNDLALALASHPIRIEAPIPGRSLVGIEIPNKGRAEVRLRNLIENDAFQRSSANLNIALGRDVSGTPVYTDLTRMPHLLVAGATGTGKTIFLSTLITSLLYQPSTPTKSAGPETVRFILVDPKRVEFPVYSNLPHLLCPVIYNADQTIGALRWLTSEMERRFGILSAAKSRDIKSFNEKALKDENSLLPFIILIIDELADLMAAKGREIESGIVRLAQMARAVGIHLVVATQRPSVEVITGLIKANITSRITFQVASQVDSRTVIDSSGAEKLLGAGDMLYISSYTPKPKRIQAAYISDKEVKKVTKHIVEQAGLDTQIEMDNDLMQELEKSVGDGLGTGPKIYEGDEDPLFEDAKKLVMEANKASASYLQRRLRVGYARAARLIDILEDKGIVGQAEGSKPREVYGEIMNTKGIPAPPEEQEEQSEDNKQWKKV